MRKLFIIFFVLLIASFVILVFRFSPFNNDTKEKSKPIQASERVHMGEKTKEITDQGLVAEPDLSVSVNVDSDDTDFSEEIESPQLQELKPASDLYSSADEAMQALIKGAATFDKIVLEQFIHLKDNCAWCPNFYSEVKERVARDDISKEERKYFAQVLGLSGRIDNISFLIENITNNLDPELADAYTEALENSYGDDEFVAYLGEQLLTGNELIKESIVAALTNHGSRQAIEILYTETVNAGGSNIYYSRGIGLAEIIPDEDAIPYLEELVNSKDEYSHLVVKALLNAGDLGLESVLNIISQIDDPGTSKKLLTDAIDHVTFQAGTKDVVTNFIANTKSEDAKKFAEEVLRDLNQTYATDGGIILTQ